MIITLTPLQQKRISELDQQIAVLQSQATLLIETIADCQGFQLDPKGSWTRISQTQVEVDVIEVKKDDSTTQP